MRCGVCISCWGWPSWRLSGSPQTRSPCAAAQRRRLPARELIAIAGGFQFPRWFVAGATPRWGQLFPSTPGMLWLPPSALGLSGSSACYTVPMKHRAAKHLFAIASRLLLALALLLANGPWAQVLASTQAGDCAHMMSTMQHSAGNGDDCCADMSGDHGMPACGKHGSLCSGVCAALYAASCSGTLPAVLAVTGLPLAVATPLPRSSGRVPSSLFASPALRPPIFL